MPEPRELREGDLIAIGQATLRLANGELTEPVAGEGPPG